MRLPLITGLTLLIAASGAPALAQPYSPSSQPAGDGGRIAAGPAVYETQGVVLRANRKFRRPAPAVSRYRAPGRPVYYNDGMIRTGVDWPFGTVGKR